jgi:hypothetical protein
VNHRNGYERRTSMSRPASAVTFAMLFALALGLAPSAHAQTAAKDQSTDAFFYRGTGGVPPP